MPFSLSNDIKNLPDRFAVEFESPTKTWRILDLRHPELSKLENFNTEGLEVDVPDNNPAVTIIDGVMFAALIAEAIRLGELDMSVVGMGSNVRGVDTLDRLTDESNEKDTKIVELENALREEKQKRIAPHGSEEFMLKRDIIDALKKLAMAETINEVK